MSDYQLMFGDCLDKMSLIPDSSVDMILADLPYGTTACAFDERIPFESLWSQYKRILKPTGAVILFGTEPFSSLLRMSNLKWYRYDWVWNKNKAANFLFGNRMPLKVVENICVFYKYQPTYNPLKIINPKGCEKSGRKRGGGAGLYEHLPNAPKVSRAGKNYENDKLLPTVLLSFSRDAKPIHPTQKPVALLEYLIRTYTNEGELVLDNVMGSGSTGEACLRVGRRFIGIEKDPGYFEIASRRLERVAAELRGELNHLPMFEGLAV